MKTINYTAIKDLVNNLNKFAINQKYNQSDDNPLSKYYEGQTVILEILNRYLEDCSKYDA